MTAPLRKVVREDTPTPDGRARGWRVELLDCGHSFTPPWSQRCLHGPRVQAYAKRRRCDACEREERAGRAAQPMLPGLR